MIGMATPTVSLSPMLMFALVILSGLRVLNVPVIGELLPPGPLTVPAQV